MYIPHIVRMIDLLFSHFEAMVGRQTVIIKLLELLLIAVPCTQL